MDETGNCDPQLMEQSVSRDQEVAQILQLARKILKVIITNVLKNLHEQFGEDKEISEEMKTQKKEKEKERGEKGSTTKQIILLIF